MDVFSFNIRKLIGTFEVTDEILRAGCKYFLEPESEKLLEEFYLVCYERWREKGNLEIPWAVKFLNAPLYDAVQNFNLSFQEYHNYIEEEEENGEP